MTYDVFGGTLNLTLSIYSGCVHSSHRQQKHCKWQGITFPYPSHLFLSPFFNTFLLEFHRSVYIFSRCRTSYSRRIISCSHGEAPAQNGDKFQSIFSDNLQPIATRGKKARGTLLVDQHCSNGCSIKRAPFSVRYYNEISGGHIGRGIVRRRCSAGPVLPLWFFRQFPIFPSSLTFSAVWVSVFDVTRGHYSVTTERMQLKLCK